MHIPDGLIDARTAAATAVLSGGGLALALWHVRRTLPARKIPLLGLSAAFVFAAQMLNFPVAGGTSGHLIGGTLIAVLLGPSAAVIAISAVLITQCLMFADGGLTALGANIFNMGLIGAVGGWLIYSVVRRLFGGLFGRILAASFAAWCSTVLAAIACAGQLAASGKVDWGLAFPAMAGVHMLIGLGEGLITGLILAAIAPVRPDLLGLDVKTGPGPAPAAPAIGYGILMLYGALMALGLALFVSPFACRWPDGLDHFAQSIGIKETLPKIAAPMPEYKIPGIGSAVLATSLGGAAGTLVVFGLSWLLARALVRKRKGGDPTNGGGSAAQA